MSVTVMTCRQRQIGFNIARHCPLIPANVKMSMRDLSSVRSVGMVGMSSMSWML